MTTHQTAVGVKASAVTAEGPVEGGNMSEVALQFSLVVPIYNEEETVAKMLEEVDEVLAARPLRGAVRRRRGGRPELGGHARVQARPRRGVATRGDAQGNAGQSAAVMAGVEQAAPIVATLDGDMQNDPRDIPSMLARVEQGEADAVVGVRAQRRDTFVRRASSKVGNAVRNILTGDKVKDAACGIKVIRRSYFLRAPGSSRCTASWRRWWSIWGRGA